MTLSGTGKGSMQSDPLFTDAAARDYTLRTKSPAIRKGVNMSEVAALFASTFGPRCFAIVRATRGRTGCGTSGPTNSSGATAEAGASGNPVPGSNRLSRALRATKVSPTGDFIPPLQRPPRKQRH